MHSLESHQGPGDHRSGRMPPSGCTETWRSLAHCIAALRMTSSDALAGRKEPSFTNHAVRCPKLCMHRTQEQSRVQHTLLVVTASSERSITSGCNRAVCIAEILSLGNIPDYCAPRKPSGRECQNEAFAHQKLPLKCAGYPSGTFGTPRLYGSSAGQLSPCLIQLIPALVVCVKTEVGQVSTSDGDRTPEGRRDEMRMQQQHDPRGRLLSLRLSTMSSLVVRWRQQPVTLAR